ncbi:MAG: magnesium-translocating P-type ATPase [Lachnospiraceae bacterium]|nr:magnesium-translocating P-type ATPase [Lachnospiraceae bacterium]
MRLYRKQNKESQKNKVESEQKLRNYASLDCDVLFEKFHTTSQGLSKEQIDDIQEKHGKNIIQSGRKNTILRRLYEALINPFNIVLLAIIIITYVTDVIYHEPPDFVTMGIVLLIIILSSTVAFVQGERSNTAAESLSKMISNKADVWRDNALVEIAMEEVVPGDIVKLSAGDMIPADVRFLLTKDAFVAQAALTGESNPVEKFSSVSVEETQSLTDIKNIGFMGSNIVSGSATAIVLATGNDTYIGTMAKTLSGDRAKNSFERGVDSVSRLLIRVMVIMVPVVFLINGLTKDDWMGAFLFAITIAVGLTPEMLPMIMTSTLAKGAVFMSKQDVIVKTLGAIQIFGEMDILCTDKTGTLTEDKIILEKYMNVLGEDDTRIFRHAYMNSYFQTGLKNLIDLAIINRAVEQGFENILEKYRCIDEIPFDFSRRCMSVVLQDGDGKTQLITKGAVEEMLSISSYVEWEGQILPLSDEMKEKVLVVYEKYNHEGLRMLAVAQKNEVPGVENFCVEDESDMVLIGFVGFLDPPKETAATAITALKENGVRTVVLTGDSEGVAIKVCNKVGVNTSSFCNGNDVENMDDATLLKTVEHCSLYAKLSPSQKERVVKAFQTNGHTVGYMGDGINDAPPLHQSDVGISVDSAVDIAKETADIILLKKDLMVLEHGVIAGRKTFGNIVKYIKMATSGNFGNMVSVLVASIFLPFLPMLPIQILTQNLLCDFSQMGMPFDNVDKEYIEKPRKWETKSIKSFMTFMGSLSSVFDIACFAIMWWIIRANTQELSPLFQGGWFIFGTVSQVLVIHMIRTGKIPFLQSKPSLPLMISTFVVVVAACIIAFTNMATLIDMSVLPVDFVPWLILLLVAYCASTLFMKQFYIRKFGEWL